MKGGGVREHFDRFGDSFEEARAARGSSDRLFRMAGRMVRVQMTAGSALAELLLPALAHLQPAREEAAGFASLPADLTISAWDAAEAGPGPDLPWPGREAGGERDILHFRGQGLRILRHRAAGLVILYDEVRRRALYRTDSAASLSFAECASPFRPILQWWAVGRGGLLIHAAAVEAAGRGALVPGGEGAGKSTTAALCLRRGLGLAGDDYVLLTPGRPARAASLYGTLKLTPDSLARLPDLAALARPIGRLSSEKAVLYLWPHFAQALKADLPIDVLLLARRGAPRTRVARPAGAAETMKALAPSTLFGQSGDRAEAFRLLAGLARTTPAFVLELGPDFEEVAPAVASFLGERPA